MQQSVIAILTDYGTRDGRAAKLIGAVKRAEETLDVCLAVNNFPAGDVPGAAATLHGFLGYFPARTVTAALIGETDGKGRPFPPIAAKAPDGKVFLVPNNGLLTVWEQTHGIASSFSIVRAPASTASIMPWSSETGMNAPESPPT